jgi:hypothetical protein
VIETFDLTVPGRPTIAKDPQATLDYSWDWLPWLSEIGDAIAGFSVTSAGITVESASRIGGIVTAWVSGGTVGRTYGLTCRIDTDGGRRDERTIYLQVRDR